MEEKSQSSKGDYEDIDNIEIEAIIKRQDNNSEEKDEKEKNIEDDEENGNILANDGIYEDIMKEMYDFKEGNENNEKKENNEKENNEKENNEKENNEKENNEKKENINDNIMYKKKYNIPTTKELIRGAIIMSKEKMGSEMVQIEFRNGDEEIKQKIFNALKSEILILSTDQFGNYVIQALLYYGDEEKLNIIFETFKNKLFDLSTHTYGCRVIQTLISVLSNSKKDKEKIKYILKELTDLDGYLGDLFTDKNGNHVIQQIINVLDIDDLTTIFDAILKNISNIIDDKYGSRIIQAFLNKCKKEDKKDKKDKENKEDKEHQEGKEDKEDQALKIINKIFEKYKDKVNYLCKNQFSNYILQYILENYTNYIENINKSLQGNIYILSLDKYASNIVEKVLEYGNKEQKDEIGKELINNNNDCILNLSNNNYGNYVIQKAIEFCSEDIGKEIIKKVREIPKDKRGKYWKYIYNVLEKYD